LNIFIRFRDIRRRTSKSSEIGPNFACFWPLKFFGGARPKILDRHYKIRPITDHRAKFHAGRPTHLGDFASVKKTSGVKLKSAPQAIAFGRTNYVWRKRWYCDVQEWNDYNLAWNESEYGNVSSVRIPPDNIWRPDIFMYNR